MIEILQDTITSNINNDTFQLLREVDEFYNSAWNKLVITGSIIIGVIGVIVPIIIQYWQQRTLRIQEANFKQLVVTEIDKAKNDLKMIISEELKSELEAFEEKQIQTFTIIEGKLLQTQGNLFLTKNFEDSIDSFLRAADLYIKGNKPELLLRMLKMIEHLIPHYDNIEKFNNHQDEIEVSLIDLLIKIKSSDHYQLCKHDIKSINKKMKELEEKDQKNNRA